MRTPRVPSYRLHKPTGKAVVTIGGRDHYLGDFNSPESRRTYDRLITSWLANNRYLPPDADPGLTVTQALDAYWHHAKGYYGEKTSQAERVRTACDLAVTLYGDTPAARFGPQAFKACRQRGIDRGWCRRYTNHVAACLRRAWKWLASEEMVPASTWHALQSVEGLKRGRTTARESEPVKPVPQPSIDAVRAELSPQLAAVIDMQLLTGARPGEILAIRPCDVDRSGPVWHCRLDEHKNQHRGHSRTILVGPRGQSVLSPWLLRGAELFCFSPREAVEQRLRDLGHRVRFGKGRVPGARYTASAYCKAIHAACDRAFPAPPPAGPHDGETARAWQKRLTASQKAELKRWRVAHRWHPHQLRHNAATRLVEEFGWDIARIILGHRSLDATRIYGEDALRKAIDVMQRVG